MNKYFNTKSKENKTRSISIPIIIMIHFFHVMLALIISLALISNESFAIRHIADFTENSCNIDNGPSSSSSTSVIQENSFEIKEELKSNNNGFENNTFPLGAWVPDELYIEDMQPHQQIKAINSLLEKGFNEYYFTMTDFNNKEEIDLIERFLNNTDKTSLDIILILRPPSEGGAEGNYNWKGWINYFNDLKEKHESFSGFAIDDFNWISTRNDTLFWKNIDFMLYSNLEEALAEKRKDVKFYPVIYFEGLKTNTIHEKYGKYIDKLLLVSASYYNITKLEKNLQGFMKYFGDKPASYIVYPTITYNYTNQGYDPPSDRLVMGTLSIASRIVDGIVVWHEIEDHIIKDFIQYKDEKEYLETIHMMEKLQIADENCHN